ncbi:methyltransferase [Maricurvus nonylphenolicus]|uniref:methyltransferase n=1 Tax=Maricurvus nonylphenolicus TaxID=1008307 RepID=UPI0036F27C9F
MEIHFQSPFQETLTLERFPRSKATGREKSLRAWDAADEYLLHHLYDEHREFLEQKPTTAIVNDTFGALTTALRQLNPCFISDSFLAHQACKENLSTNGVESSQIHWLNSLQVPPKPLDLVLIRIPKTRALLEDQLYRLRPLLHDKSVIIGCAMVKNLHANDIQAFSDIVGPSHSSLAQKKARLVFCHYQSESEDHQKTSPYPSELSLPELDLKLTNHANVFSQGGLDIGSRFFIQHLPEQQGEKDIIDLGCGNGLLGILAARANPQAHLHFTDESYMAVASAQVNMHRHNPEQQANFYVDNCLDAFASNSADIILNNPPFHQQHTVGDHIARRMFKDAKRVLRAGGELWVVGNRHLNYHQQLKRLFGNCELIASNKKFVILKAIN